MANPMFIRVAGYLPGFSFESLANHNTLLSPGMTDTEKKEYDDTIQKRAEYLKFQIPTIKILKLREAIYMKARMKRGATQEGIEIANKIDEFTNKGERSNAEIDALQRGALRRLLI